MSQEPKKRHSRARQGKRRASIHLSVPSFVKCRHCGVNRLPHTICPACGFYDGRQVAQVTKAARNENA